MAKKARAASSYICALCNVGFSRRGTVKDPHFARCIAKNGNPQNLVWDEHPSCWMRFPDGTRGKSGLIPPGVSRALEAWNEAHGSPSLHDGDEVGEEEEDDMDENGESGLEEDEVTDSMGTASDPDPGRDNNATWTSISSSPLLPPGPTLPYRVPLPPIQAQPHCLWLSQLTMNQLANVVLSASRKYAGLGDTEAADVWNLWHSLLPAGVISNVSAPSAGQSQKERQQAVVWLAQDVYGALLVGRHNLEDQLKIVSLWRNITKSLGDEEGLSIIHHMVAEVTGEHDPMVLARIFREHPASDLGLQRSRDMLNPPGTSNP